MARLKNTPINKAIAIATPIIVLGAIGYFVSPFGDNKKYRLINAAVTAGLGALISPMFVTILVDVPKDAKSK